MLKKGKYNALPELALDDSCVSFTPAQETCTYSTHTVSIVPYSTAEISSTSQVSVIGPMGRGMSSAVLIPRSRQDSIRPKHERPWYAYSFMYFNYQSALDRLPEGYGLRLYTPLY